MFFMSWNVDSLRNMHVVDMMTCECLSILTELISSNRKEELVLQSILILNNLANKPELLAGMEGFGVVAALAGVLHAFGGAPEAQLTLHCLELQELTWGQSARLHDGAPAHMVARNYDRCFILSAFY